MTSQDRQSRPVRVVFKRGSTMTKLAVLAALVLSMAALWTLTLITQQTRARAAELKAEAAQLEQENSRLEDKIEDLGSVQGVENIANEELGLVDPDTVIFGSGE